jgi:hypothetical protein
MKIPLPPEQQILLSIILGGISAFFAVVAFIQFFRANRFQKRLAAAQGVFRSPDIWFSLCHLNTTVSDFTLILPVRPLTYYELPFSITLQNAGQQSASDVEIFLRAPKSFLCRAREMEVTGASGKEIKFHKVSESKNMLTICWAFKILHPGEGVVLMFPASVTGPTSVRDSGVFTTKDEKQLRVDWEVQYSFVLNIVLMQMNQPAVMREFKLRVIDTEDLLPAAWLDKFEDSLREKSKREAPRSLRRGFQGSRASPSNLHGLLVPEFSSAEIKPLNHDKGTVVRFKTVRAFTGFKFSDAFNFPAVHSADFPRWGQFEPTKGKK